jgi:Uma2 family endonuclease
MPRARSSSVMPGLAVEISSLTNSAGAGADKLEEYYEAGVMLVWVVYPGPSTVCVYTSTTTVRVLAPGDELEGGDVLPRFRVQRHAVSRVSASAGSSISAPDHRHPSASRGRFDGRD